MNTAPTRDSAAVTLFLCGDVMTGRGIDQVLPHHGNPRLFEFHVQSALEYVELAEERNGPISMPVTFSYVWGDALEELDRVVPDASIMNLETSITAHGEAWPGKGIHYRMHPKNVPCLTAVSVDCCVLANNHVLDWGRLGLLETLDTLHAVGIATAGAGRDDDEATATAVLSIPDGRRVLVLALGAASSGIPEEWAAAGGRPGVSILPDLSAKTVRRISDRVRDVKRDGDVAVASIHWGGNWGYEVARQERAFAHALIDRAGIDIVHGHSSHHPKGIEVYRNRPIIYGCGDFINDYEGIPGYEHFRDDLVLMYVATIDPTGGLIRFRMIPFQIRRFRLNRASTNDSEWLRSTLTRESEVFGTRVDTEADGALRLRWSEPPAGRRPS